MGTFDNFQQNGWYLSNEGLNKLMENGGPRDPKIIMRKALDVDLREIGAPIINSELSKDYFGPVVLQITKIKNIAAPKVKQNSQTAPRMLKLSLTDGQNTCQAIEIKPINSLNLDNTPPGTKIFINGAQISSGALLIDSKNCVILGGNVPALVERWEISKMMPSHNRASGVSDEGPPRWVNFGKKIMTQNLQNQNFKSLKNQSKEDEKDSDFQNQRQDLISEAAQGAVKKVFGGGVKIPQTFKEPSNTNYNNNKNNQNFENNSTGTYKSKENTNTVRELKNPREKKGKNSREKPETEKLEKPSQRVSLFDFLEDKLPVTEPPKTQEKPKTDFASKGPNKYQKPYEKSNYDDRKGYDHQRGDQAPRNNQKYPNRYEKPESRGYQKNFEKSPQNDYQKNFQNQEKPPRFQKNQQNFPSFQKSENFQKKDNFQNNDSFQKRNDNSQRNENSQRGDSFQRNDNFQRNDSFQKNEGYQRNDNFKGAPRNFEKKPDTNNFVNKLTTEMNNISLYNLKFDNERGQKTENVGNSSQYRWKIGERCMAKYWEDNKYYNAIVTGITNKTCMVEFIEYGNFEEVLHCDCIPITAENDTQTKSQFSNRNFNENQQFSGNLEFRRKPRPYVNSRNQNRSYQN